MLAKNGTNTVKDLYPALQEGLITPQSEDDNLVTEIFKTQQEIQLSINDSQFPKYKFVHDRVQQAAYSLISPEQKQRIHLKIGQLLLNEISVLEREDNIFIVVNQLNLAQELITAQVQRDELARMNLLAGRKALASTAYVAAMKYLTTGIKLLTDNCWEKNYELTLALYEAAAKAAYLAGEFEQMKQFVQTVLVKAKTLLDKVKIYEITIQSYGAQNQAKEAIITALKILKELGVELPENPTQSELQKDLTEISLNLADRSIQDLVELPNMRTDSVHLSEQAIAAARSCVEQLYGKQYLSPQPRQYTTKSKGAQEAHEAIRPAGSTFRTPQETGLSGRELQLYDLIWKRTIASQMADSRQTQITVQLQVEDAGFKASGKRIDFPGYLRAYVEGSDDPEAALEDQEIILPDLKVGDRPNCIQLEVLGHQTQPPARYTEATLVKTLESEGIGRPSTYASIIGTILDKGYAQLVNNTLVPTFTAFAVTDLLEKYFPDIVDPSFTSKMEQTLDDIATGEAEWLPYLREFYLGEKGLEPQVREKEDLIDPNQARTVELENLGAKVRIGKFGPYIEVENGNNVVTASIPKDLTPADLDPQKVEILLRQKTSGPEEIGRHPETGEPIYVLIGRYGPYIQLGDKSDDNPKPKQVSLPKEVKPEDVTLEMAVGLLSLPRTLGTHPETGATIQANLGPYGPYIVHNTKQGKDYRSLKAGDDVLTVSLERALELLSEPKKARSNNGRSKAALRELGSHPEDGEPVNIYNGPYGPYIKHGKINARIPEGVSAEEVNLDTALQLLATKASSESTRKTTKSTKSTTKSTTSSGAKSKSKSSTTAAKKTS